MDFCTLQQVKDFLGIPSSNTNQDTEISTLIPAASRAAQNFMQRQFDRTAWSKRFNGKGTCRMMVPDYPIISVQTVQVGLTAIPASPDSVQAGWMAAEREILLVGGYEFCRGLQNVLLAWTSGFTTTETDFIPAGSPYTLTPATDGWAASDLGVTFVGGAALVRVGSSPVAGQYSYSSGVYTFAAADAGKQVTISYDYVPSDVMQAVRVLVATWLKQRQNLGVKSRTLAGESVLYEDKTLPPAVQQMLWPFRKLVPVT